MSLYAFLILALGIYALLEFSWLPRVRLRLTVDRGMAAIGQSGLYACVGFLRSVALIASLSTVLLITCLMILNVAGANDVATAGRLLGTVQWARHWLHGFGQVWGWGTTCALLLGMAVMAYRRGKLRVAKCFERVRTQEMERLKSDFNRGHWPALPETRQMSRLSKRIAKMRHELRDLPDSGPGSDPKTDAQRDFLVANVELLEQRLTALDFERRMNCMLSSEVVVLPAPRTRWDKFLTFWMSEGLVASLQGGSRMLACASLFLLVPCFLGIHSAATDAKLEQRQLSLADFSFRLAQGEVTASWNAATNGLPPVVRELTPAEMELINDAVTDFQKRRVLNPMWSRVLSKARGPIGSAAQLKEPLEGRHLFDKLEDVFKRKPSLLRQLKAPKVSFQQSIAVSEQQIAFKSQLLSSILGDDSGLAETICQTLDRGSRDKLRAMADLEERRFAAEFVHSGDWHKAIERVTGIASAPCGDGELQPAMRVVEERVAACWAKAPGDLLIPTPQETPGPNQGRQSPLPRPGGNEELPGSERPRSASSSPVEEVPPHSTSTREKFVSIRDTLKPYAEPPPVEINEFVHPVKPQPFKAGEIATIGYGLYLLWDHFWDARTRAPETSQNRTLEEFLTQQDARGIAPETSQKLNKDPNSAYAALVSLQIQKSLNPTVAPSWRSGSNNSFPQSYSLPDPSNSVFRLAPASHSPFDLRSTTGRPLLDLPPPSTQRLTTPLFFDAPPNTY